MAGTKRGALAWSIQSCRGGCNKRYKERQARYHSTQLTKLCYCDESCGCVCCGCRFKGNPGYIVAT